MKLSALSLSLLLSAGAASALKVKVKQTKHGVHHAQRRSGNLGVSVSKPSNPTDKYKTLAAGSDKDSLDINTVHDLLYIANVTVGGTDYPVQLDTGSSDLWIKGPTSPLPNTTQTSLTYNLTYGIGWANGHVSFAEVEFAGIKIPKQAFLDVSAAVNPALGYGANGILGLGFTSLSTIDALVNRTDSDDGRSLLFKAFEDNPSEPNFIAFSLQRSTNADDDVEGIFSIGEYEDKYSKVKDSPQIATWPVNSPSRWNVLLEAMIVNGESVTVKTNVTGAPSNRAVVLLDSGTSYTYASVEVCNAIYGGVKGASYSSTLGQWIVPCDAEIDMALQFGGQMFGLHPLDVAPKSLTNTNKCLGSFIPQSVSVGAGEFDWLVGDNVLRSMYSVYDFGDFDSNGKMGNPYVKLLSLIDPNKASADFATARGSTARTGITYTPQASSAQAAQSGSGSTSVDISTDVAKVLDTLGTWFPAIAAVMALNALVLLALLIMAVWYFVSQRKKLHASQSLVVVGDDAARPRSQIGRMTRPSTAMELNATRDSYIQDDVFVPPTKHQYQPVSMALSEAETLAAPASPNYKGGFKYDPESAKGLERPQSIAVPRERMTQGWVPSGSSPLAGPSSAGSNRGPSFANFPGQAPEDEPFTPPRPTYRNQSGLTAGDRPRSSVV